MCMFMNVCDFYCVCEVVKFTTACWLGYKATGRLLKLFQ